MTSAQLEHLKRIDAHLEKLLAQAEKRTPGRWYRGKNRYVGVDELWIVEAWETNDLKGKPNATFIASCAGNAEAGWKAIRAAITRILGCPHCGGTGMTKGWVPTYSDPDNASMAPEAEPCCEEAADILAAFPLELIEA
jgi:hypothetical protein